MKKPRTLITVACMVGITLALMIKRVNVEGDHASYLVIAPYPSLEFEYGGGEEGAWRRKHPGEKEPWWLVRQYIVLWEVD